ncbi:MAG: serine/threonine protein kinase [Deltaproteobacteria bacterium]|nr:serine/threonine protein kinase [Deltaproteobacteria bacterium]
MTYTFSPSLSQPFTQHRVSPVRASLQATAETRRNVRPSATALPFRLDRYVAIELIGAGGMGVVYRAMDRENDREVALKLLPATTIDARMRERFTREIRQTARLTHPNTIRVLGQGEAPDGSLFYAMELVRGADLARLVRTYGKMPPERVVHVLRQAAEALGEAHDLGVVHRDVKPPNLLLGGRSPGPDTVKVVDFGLVKDLAGRDPDVTLDGMVLGTPGFLPFEAVDQPGTVDARSDVYMLGAVAYYLLSGSRPYDLGARTRTWLQAMRNPPTPLVERIGAPLAPDLDALVMRCLSHDPTKRPANGRALAEELAASSLAGRWTDEDARRFWMLHDAPCARA